MSTNSAAETKARRAHVCSTNKPIISTPKGTAENENDDKSRLHLLRAQAPRSSLWPPTKRCLSVAFSCSNFNLDGEMEYADAKRFVQTTVTRECNGICGLTFTFLPDERYTQSDIRVTFHAPSGSWSMVGTDADTVSRTEATMNFGWLDSNEASPGGVILHEFGHAMGLVHEHSTSKFPFRWDREAVIEELTAPPNDWTEAQIDLNVFDIIDSQLLSHDSSEYDGDSIMGYAFPARYFQQEPGEGYQSPPANGIEAKSRYSSTDIATLRRLYPKSDVTSVTATQTSTQWEAGALFALIVIVIAFAGSIFAVSMRKGRPVADPSRSGFSAVYPRHAVQIK